MNDVRGLDGWIERETDERRSDIRPPVRYQCRECDWHGRSDLAAFEHHARTHHRIRIGLSNEDAVFSCCQTSQERGKP